MQYKNRGMFLESIINKTLKYYALNNLALFHKKDVPVVFSGIKRNTQGKPEIKKGWISTKSTTDYYGIYDGLFITFEAKSTNSKIFPLSNIKEHQMNYVNKINKLGGYGFFIIYFAFTESFYIITEEWLKKINKKSINLEDVQQHGYEVELIYPGIIDFLPVIKNLI